MRRAPVGPTIAGCIREACRSAGRLRKTARAHISSIFLRVSGCRSDEQQPQRCSRPFRRRAVPSSPFPQWLKLYTSAAPNIGGIYFCP